jgi:hypothetical protein
MVGNAPLHLVTNGANGEIYRPIDQAHPDAVALSSTFRTQVNESSCGSWAHVICAAPLHDLEFAGDTGHCVFPFLRDLALGNRLGIRAEQCRYVLDNLDRRHGFPGARIRAVSSERDRSNPPKIS